MMGAIQSGFRGMQKASSLVNNAAADIAKANTPASPQASTAKPAQGGNMSRDMVNLLVGKSSYDANARVVEAALQTHNSLDKIV